MTSIVGRGHDGGEDDGVLGEMEKENESWTSY